MNKLRWGAVWSLVWAVAGAAVAEDVTVTTYYPSPRGVYEELRTTGDVGIGTTAVPVPGRLYVLQNGAARALYVVQNGAADAFRVDDVTGDTTPFVIDQNGNVGIGTATPPYKLTVTDGNADHYVGGYNPPCCGGSQIPAGQFRGFTTQWDTDLAMVGLRNYGGDRKDLVLNNEQGSDNIRLQIAGIDAMFVGGSGNVGIGTTNPATRLTVIGDGTGVANIGGGFCASNYTGISLNGLTGSCGVYNILSSPTDQNLYLNRPSGLGMYFRENNADQMVIQSGGNVKITQRLGTYGWDPVTGLPGGWGGGIHTWDVYAEATIGAGYPGGPVNSWMNRDGNAGFAGTVSANNVTAGGVNVCRENGVNCPTCSCTCP